MKKEVMRHAVVMEKHAFPEHPWAEPPMPVWFKNHTSSRIFSLLCVTISVQMEDLLGIGVLEDWLEDVRNASGGYFSGSGRLHAAGGGSPVELCSPRHFAASRSAPNPGKPKDALREGWDNPNVFQICSLNETRSKDKKRQEIGRACACRSTAGASAFTTSTSKGGRNRLFPARASIAHPIDQEASKSIWEALITNGYLTGDGKVTEKFDPGNPLFELALPQEFAELGPAVVDTIRSRLFRNRVVNARKRRTIRFNKRVRLSPEFEAHWNSTPGRGARASAPGLARLSPEGDGTHAPHPRGNTQAVRKARRVQAQSAGFYDRCRTGNKPGAA